MYRGAMVEKDWGWTESSRETINVIKHLNQCLSNSGLAQKKEHFDCLS